jgi:Lipid A 3-O-deacylase (PagL)/Outer membrane protein beta-barrel domain
VTRASLGALAAALLLPAALGHAEDNRTQFPKFLANSYFEVGAGYIEYPFSERQLEPGFAVESVRTPHAAARVVLLGYRFNPHLALQASYMRPIEWVRYKDVNGVPATRTVWMNLAGLTFRGSLPLGGALFLDGEAGLGVVTRRGFETAEGAPIVKDASYWSSLLGGGLRYRLSDSWELGANATYAPSHASVQQPHTLLVSGGFRYNMHPLPEERVARNAQSGHAFPRNLLQVGYASDNAGFGVNHFLSGGTVPVFWGGLAQVRNGVTAHYQRNVFHTRRTFSLDWGASVGHWTSRLNGEKFYTASVFPLFRFTLVRTRPVDFYVNYSLAGPTSISRVVVDGHDTGRHFTFQDFVGIGFYAGHERHVNAEVKIGHYSNGNLFPQNAGVSIPLTFNLGYTFH